PTGRSRERHLSSGTWRWCCLPGSPRQRWKRSCVAPAGRCSSRWSCSMSTAGRGCRAGIAAWRGGGRSAIRVGRCGRPRQTPRSPRLSRSWRESLAYDGERADVAALDQLETVLRHVMDELTTWHTRALKAEGDRGGAPAGVSARGGELEQENK